MMAKLHRTELPYDPTPRAVAQDATLPLDALGVWVWARSLPDGAELSVDSVLDLHRGLGADRAARAVQALRAHGLWHTLTYRTGGGLVTSRVVIPPEPWTREEAAGALGLAVENLLDGPSERRHLRAVSAGRTDTRKTEDRSTEDRSTEHRSPGCHSLEQNKRTTPLPPRSAGGTVDGCNQGHTRPTRDCCTARAIARRATAAKAVADREAERAKLAELRSTPRDPEAAARGLAAARAAVDAARKRRTGDQ